MNRPYTLAMNPSAPKNLWIPLHSFGTVALITQTHGSKWMKSARDNLSTFCSSWRDPSPEILLKKSFLSKLNNGKNLQRWRKGLASLPLSLSPFSQSNKRVQVPQLSVSLLFRLYPAKFQICFSLLAVPKILPPIKCFHPSPTTRRLTKLYCGCYTLSNHHSGLKLWNVRTCIFRQ